MVISNASHRSAIQEMNPTRRWLQYSLRSFLILLTALAVWLGIIVKRAAEQREAVKAIEALGGRVTYDWKLSGFEGCSVGLPRGPLPEPRGPRWLRWLVGDEYFQEVRLVKFAGGQNRPQSDAFDAIPFVQRLSGRKTVCFLEMSEDNKSKLKTALPNCRVLFLPFGK
jgi:hypothetical protein